MLPTPKDIKQDSEHSNDASDTTFGLSNLSPSEIASFLEDIEVANDRENTNNKLDNPEGMQYSYEWPSPEDEQLTLSSTQSLPDFEDDKEVYFMLFVKDNLDTKAEKVPAFELNLDSLPCLSQDISESNDPISCSHISSEQACDLSVDVHAQVPGYMSKVRRNKLDTRMVQFKDAVLKRVLNKIRNYYRDDFKEFTKFPVNKRAKFNDVAFNDCLAIYIRNRFSQEPQPEMIRALSSLIHDKEGKERETLISQILHKFTYTRFEKLIKNATFAYLVQCYSETVEKDTLTLDESLGLAMIISMTLKD